MRRIFTRLQACLFQFVLPGCALLAGAMVVGIGQPWATADESVPASLKSATATHVQKKIVQAANVAAGEKLEDFCIDSQGRILALVGAPDADSVPSPLSGLIQSVTGGSAKVECAIHVYDAEGELAAKWPVGFTGQAIGMAPDGTILVGGDGRVARFDAAGKKLHEAESPQMTYINQNSDEMKARAQDQLESDRAVYAEQLKSFEEQLKELQAAEAKKPAEAAKPQPQQPDEAIELVMNTKQMAQYVQAYKSMVDNLQKKTADDVLKEVLARARRTHSITASKDEVFVSCPAMAGYGFGVWRTDAKFGQAKEIIKSLSGCCGQMDVQCCNGELYVCENSRHRVIRFDREGKEIGQFGKRDRTGEGENFGGCCNPMNLCFNKNGNLYVSESNGVVKHFTPDGKYLGVVGIASVQPGCKNSCVGVTADDDRLFYIDIYKSQVIVLARADAAAAK
jgi:sugar lactone lactonase YvrE